MPNAAGNWTEVTSRGSISAIGDIGNVSSNAILHLLIQQVSTKMEWY